jgi:hypothetical protein
MSLRLDRSPWPLRVLLEILFEAVHATLVILGLLTVFGQTVPRLMLLYLVIGVAIWYAIKVARANLGRQDSKATPIV